VNGKVACVAEISFMLPEAETDADRNTTTTEAAH
jgi:hypothetical protein